jgi:hypothetical protein
MVSVLTSSVVDSGFKPQSGQTKDYEIGTLTGQKYFLTKVIIFWLENGKFEFSRKQYIFLKHSKREFCAEFYYHF